MRSCQRAFIALTAGLLGACAPSEVDIAVVQLNDVYEIGYANGEPGSLARVAEAIHALRDSADVVVPVLAGDFVSPSALGTARVDGSTLDGAQMVDVLNLLGLRFAAVGNHEFDVGEDAFHSRLGESSFPWLAANVRQPGSATPLDGVLAWDTLRVRTHSGLEVVLGFVGVTMPLPTGSDSWFETTDPVVAMEATLPRVEAVSDVQIALTHLPIAVDRKIARRFPELDLVVGGHEHEATRVVVGRGRPVITKAQSNARSIWIHRIRYNTLNKTFNVSSVLRRASDLPRVNRAVHDTVMAWFAKGFEAFRREGFNPPDTVGLLYELDGRDSSVRSGATTLTEALNAAMLDCVPDARLSVYNAGAIRIDDVIPAGEMVLEYDVLRILPFRSGAGLWAVDATGARLRDLLRRGRAATRVGTGGFLQVSPNVTGNGDDWSIEGTPIDDARTYRIVINGFLAHGGDGLGFHVDSTGVTPQGIRGDMRFALRRRLRHDDRRMGRDVTPLTANPDSAGILAGCGPS